MKYQVLKIESFKECIYLFLGNNTTRITVKIDDFPNFVFLNLPDSLSKEGIWTKKELKNLLRTIDIQDNEWSLVRWRKYYYFSEKKHSFLMLYSFQYQELAKKIVNLLKDIYIKEVGKIHKEDLTIDIFYANFTVVQKFSAITKINPGYWVTGTFIKNEDYYTIGYRNLQRVDPPSSLEFPKIRIACLDFEVNSHRKNKFPDPWEPPDEIYLASIVVSTYEKTEGFLIVLKEPIQKAFKELPISIKNTEEEEASKIIYANSELELLREVERVFKENNLDIITTFNGSGFDFPYWKGRIDSIGEELGFFGKIEKQPIFKFNDWGSSAHKSRAQQLLVVPGISVIDLYVILRRDTFHPIYTLEYLSQKILNEKGKKDHLPAEEQFRIYKEGNSEEWLKLLHYSLRDSFAPINIIEKLKIVNNLYAMSSIIGINIEEIYARGQQYRLENKIFQKLIEDNVILDFPITKTFDKFKGATVQEPKIGLFQNVACIDFSSLYPSIMIAFNISHDTFVGTNILKPPKGLKFDDLNIIEIEPGKKHYFVRKEIRIGTLPYLINDFLKSRKEKKKLMKTEKDAVLAANLDAEQNALKVIANSSYGLLGAQNGKLPLYQGAESITAKGRSLINFVKEEIENVEGIVLAGDTDSIFFTFKHWIDLDGSDAMKLISKEVDDISLKITKKINLYPIEIIRDHLYADYLCIQKKHDIKNEVVIKNDQYYLETKYKGVILIRREHCQATKAIYSEIAISAIGRTDWGKRDSLQKRKENCLQILLNGIQNETLITKKFGENTEITYKKGERLGGILKIMSRSCSLEELAKISQVGREATEYKKDSQPIRRFIEREEKEGRPIKVGERFNWWMVRPSTEFLLSVKNKQAKKYSGDFMRKKLEDNEKIDTLYYVKSLTVPLTKLFLAVFEEDLFMEAYNLVVLKLMVCQEIEKQLIIKKDGKYTI